MDKRVCGKGECFVARVNDEVVGWSYVCELFNIERNIQTVLENYIPNFPALKKGYLAAIAVSPERAGKGIGKKLVNAYEDFSRKNCYQIIWFGTNSDNKTMKKMSEGLGYKLIGMIHNFKMREYGGMIDQHIYYKDI